MALTDNNYRATNASIWKLVEDIQTELDAVSLSGLADGKIFVGDGDGVAQAVTMSGDVTISNTGKTAIASGSIINTDIKSNAAIAFSKLATSTDIDAFGNVVDLTITGETVGDVLYFDGTNWVALAGSSLPAGIASGLAASSTLEGGDYDLTQLITTQTSGAANLTIPDFAGVNQTMAFIGLQQTLTSKILTDASCIFGANGALTKTLGFDLSGMTADNKVTLAATGTARTVTLPTAACTLVGKDTTDILENKTFDVSTLLFGANGALTKAMVISLSGATADKTTTLTFTHTDDRAITFPDANCTLVGKDTTDELENKTITAPVITDPDITQGVSDHDYSNGNVPWELSAAEEKTKYLRCTNAGEAANILGSGTDGKEFVVQNFSGEAITIKVSGQSGVQIANGKSAMVVGNGTDFVRVTADA